MDPIRRLLADPPELPVVRGLGAIVDAVADRGIAVVQAPPGTGKTTFVPPTVAAQVAGRVVVTQPRRIAARAAASRLAALLDEPVGATVGYTVRGDRQVGSSTVIEFVTSGVLLRRLQRDPDLPGVGAVVLDEVHERALDGDLVLAFLIDVRATVRPDLAIVAMSATVEAERTAALLAAGTPAPMVEIAGDIHPVTEHWVAPAAEILATDERGVTPRFLDHVATTTVSALAEHPGDALVFVPGVREVEQVMRRLGDVAEVDVFALHGRLDAADQQRALRRGTRRRIVVSTAVAESSLTVPGVRIVVDAGLSREPRTDQRRGLPYLATVRVSRAAAEQRAGRAGREAAGVVYRCWSKGQQAQLVDHPLPEIATADLTGFALELAAWGTGDVQRLALLDQPPAASFSAAQQILADLGAIDDEGTITDRGRRFTRLPTDPRLARALIDGADRVGARRASEIVALLSEQVRAPGGDLVAVLRSLRAGGPGSGSWKQAARRFEGLLDPGEGTDPTPLTDDLAVGTVVALAHPQRIARRRPGGSTYLMVSGTAASFRGETAAWSGLDWLAVADAERRPGAAEAGIRAAAPIDEDIALEAAQSWWGEVDEVTWDAGRLLARRVTRLGAIELSSSPLAEPPPAAVASALRRAIERDGWSVLPWTDQAITLRRRMAFLHAAVGMPWPDVGDEALIESIDDWLAPDLAQVRTMRDLQRLDVESAVRRLLPWPDAARLNELAPERLPIPKGATVRVEYGATGTEQPVLSVKIQDAFGWTATPRIADGRVPILVHLLTPARRPAAVTADLASFWAGPYQQVRAELRGRYPKHAWPERP